MAVLEAQAEQGESLTDLFGREVVDLNAQQIKLKELELKEQSNVKTTEVITQQTELLKEKLGVAFNNLKEVLISKMEQRIASLLSAPPAAWPPPPLLGPSDRRRQAVQTSFPSPDNQVAVAVGGKSKNKKKSKSISVKSKTKRKKRTKKRTRRNKKNRSSKNNSSK